MKLTSQNVNLLLLDLITWTGFKKIILSIGYWNNLKNPIAGVITNFYEKYYLVKPINHWSAW